MFRGSETGRIRADWFVVGRAEEDLGGGVEEWRERKAEIFEFSGEREELKFVNEFVKSKEVRKSNRFSGFQ